MLSRSVYGRVLLEGVTAAPDQPRRVNVPGDGDPMRATDLPDDGSPDTITLDHSPRKATWMKFQVTDSSGSNVGLSEIEVFAAE